MDAILFFKELKSKGNDYFELWLPILMQFEDLETQVIPIKNTIGMSKTSYYRALDYGIYLFSKNINGYSLERNRNSLVFKKTSQKNKPIEVKELAISVIKEVPKKAEKKDSKPAKVTDVKIHEEIISYLNECSGRDFKKDNKATVTLINSRLKEGYTLNDFKKVIFVKCSNWLGGKMETYIRPLTLFSNKFESYLNEIVVVEKNKQQQAYDTVSQATELGWGNS